MARRTVEFYCTVCHTYFDIRLNMDLNGNYRIHCPMPGCGHVHYRAVRDGEITGDRFPVNDSELLIEDIMPMKSSCRKGSTETELDSEVSPKAEGFLRRMWKDMVDA